MRLEGKQFVESAVKKPPGTEPDSFRGPLEAMPSKALEERRNVTGVHLHDEQRFVALIGAKPGNQSQLSLGY